MKLPGFVSNPPPLLGLSQETYLKVVGDFLFRL